MKFAIASEHRSYFERHLQVELEGLFSEQQLKSFTAAIEGVIAKRLAVPQDKFHFLAPEKQFNAGRDVWRADASLKKWIASSALGEIASELLGKKPVRLCYDQFIPSGLPEYTFENPHIETATLQTLSCVQGIIGGILVCLKGYCQPLQESLFPSKPGNTVFFAGDTPLDFTLLRAYPQNAQFLLIAYSSKTSVYIRNEADRHVHDFKNLGYVFGDRLTDDLNPIVYR